MVFQVIIKFRGTRPLTVAPTEAQAMGTTVRELKDLVKNIFPEAPGPDRIRMVFGGQHLEDVRTLGFYHIKHLSVIVIVIRLPGGGEPQTPDSADSDTDRDKPPEEPPKRRRSFELHGYPNMRK
ncbi:ubiquitin-40S ribosomal protein S27a-like [Pygocentrus nattereri]|uniref:ubiquitin-40S ribosomal protein S27a-like n=1 Tax=Pygocentrus nattereri TaxID=42514 RepID=UPI0008143D87|nr:ubiquitin-40S ribosomal protein S27a-like [Pygocentrus nattereri]